jgi:hypothetical protein
VGIEECQVAFESLENSGSAIQLLEERDQGPKPRACMAKPSRLKRMTAEDGRLQLHQFGNFFSFIRRAHKIQAACEVDIDGSSARPMKALTIEF